MRNVKSAIESNEKWTGLRSYIELIEANQESNPNVALDGVKSLVESVAKTILVDRGIDFATDASLGRLVKDATRSLPSFTVLETQDADTVIRIISGLESVSTSVGSLRNRHGVVGHGQDLHNERELDKRLANLAIECADNLASFLMGAHSAEPDGIKRIWYEDFSDFNERFDAQQEEIEVEGIIISPSRALFDQDIEAYKDAKNVFGQKEQLINELEVSGSFASTHSVINGLSKHTTFSDQQIARLMEIAVSNSQVGWIIEDQDVYNFYIQVISNRISSIDKDLRMRFWGLFDEGFPVVATPDLDDMFPNLIGK